MKRFIGFIFIIQLFAFHTLAQKADLGIFLNRFWSPSKYEDYGRGFRNNVVKNLEMSPSVVFNKYIKSRFSVEASIAYIPYSHYYSTPKMNLAYGDVTDVVELGLKGCFSFVKIGKFESRLKGGVNLGITGKDEYQYALSVGFGMSPIDSITRGTYKTTAILFPILSTAIDCSVQFAKRWKVSAAAHYQKGFIRIFEFDIYYNNGSGNNDQHAKQWGVGDFYGVQLGLRYLLKDENGNKFNRKKK